MDEDLRRVVVKEHFRQGDVVRALREADGLELDDDTLCTLATHCLLSAASFGHLVQPESLCACCSVAITCCRSASSRRAARKPATSSPAEHAISVKTWSSPMSRPSSK